MRESNLPAQLFFRSQEFKAIKVLHAFYEDSGEDAFLMQYRLAEDHCDDPEVIAKNRLAEFEGF